MPGDVLLLPGLFAHPSGGLWIPETKTALVADVHLGYSWAQRRRGELGPLVDARSREKLFRLCDELKPASFVFLGDLVHAPRPCAPERRWVEDTLNELASCAELISVRGNHDRRFAQEFANLRIRPAEAWSNDRVTAVHGDRLAVALPEHHTLIVGHLHPALPVKDASGAGHKLPVFLVTQHCIVMPAFSPFAGGYDVVNGLPADLMPFFRAQQIEAFAVTGKRAAHLGTLDRVVEKIFSGPGAPARFRGHRPRPAD